MQHQVYEPIGGGEDFAQTFKPVRNPFKKEENKGPPRKPVRQYQLPDPSKKAVITQDTPIKVNPTGQYNLNFIDWNNEWDAIMSRDMDSYESPIVGMDNATFERIWDEEMYEEMRANGVKDDFIGDLETREVNKLKKDQMCAICVDKYARGDQVFFLGCGHHFHTNCIMPWFQKQHQCPTCRYDLNKKMPASEAAKHNGIADEEDDDDIDLR